MGDPILMIPGPLSDARIFLPQMMALADVAQVVLPRRSSVQSLDGLSGAVLDEAPPSFAVVGHGVGGVVAMDLLRRAPDRVSRVALIASDPLPDPTNISAAREAALVQARAGRLEAVLAEDPAVLDYAARGDCDDLAGLILAMARPQGAEGYAAHIRILQRRPDQQRTLRTARVPLLAIGGSADPVVPLRRMDFAAGLAPVGRLVAIEGAGHLPTLEAPDQVNAALRDWLAAPAMLTRRADRSA